MKRPFFRFWVAAFIAFVPTAVFPGVTVICDGMTYSNVMTFASNLNPGVVDAVVVSSPFKSYEKTLSALDGPVYDFRDAGNKFQRGGIATYLGDENTLRALAWQLNSRGIALYAKVDLFHQVKGYNRDYWKDGDFILDLARYQDRWIVDLDSASARWALGEAIGGMRRLPVQKWVVDVRDIPQERRHDYVRYLTGSLGTSVIVISDGDQNVPQIARLEDYEQLRTNAFSPLKWNLSMLEKYSAAGGYLHYMENESPLVNNTGALVMLVLQNCNVMLSYKMLNRFHRSLIDFTRDFGWKTMETVGDDKFLIYNEDKVIAVNYSDSFAVWKYKKVSSRKGVYKGIASGAVLNISDKDMTFFMFPKSIAFWDLRNR